MREYANFVRDIVNKRDEVRNQGDENDAAFRDQKEIMSYLDTLTDDLRKYKGMFDKQHLKDHVEDYEKEVNKFDQYYLHQDKNMLA